MQLREIMTRSTYCAQPTATIAEVASMMKRHNVGAVPVCSDGRLLGIITDRDVVLECVSAGCDARQSEVRTFMTAELITATPDTDICEAVDLMAREQVRRLPIVEQGQFVGIVSLGDLALNCPEDARVAESLRGVSVPARSTRPAQSC